jgi:hypothetical protein
MLGVECFGRLRSPFFGNDLEKPESKRSRQQHGVQPDDDDLDLVQAAGTAVVGRDLRIGAQEFVKVLEQEIAGNQRSKEQAGENNPKNNIYIH